MNQNKETKNDRYLWLIILIIIVIILWLISYLLLKNCEDRGSFGDMFGGVSALFSGLAFAGVIYAIVLQKKDLGIQSQELNFTRQELVKQNETLSKQSFENTFFNLLKTQQELASNIKAYFFTINNEYESKRRDITGREFFLFSKIELSQLFNSFKYDSFLGTYNKSDVPAYLDKEQSLLNKHEIGEIDHEDYNYQINAFRKEIRIMQIHSFYSINKETWKRICNLNFQTRIAEIYKIFYLQLQYAIGQYFRHLFHIINFVKDYELTNSFDKNDVKKYIDFIQAQMSSFELMLLFYNAQIFPKMKNLLIEYNFLQNLTEDDLIDEFHNRIEGMKLKTRKQIIGELN